MNDGVVGRVVIDQNLSSYEQFFDHTWAYEVYKKVGNTLLKAPLETLILAWRLTDGNHRLPSLMMQMLRSFADGDVNAKIRARDCYIDKVVKAITGKIEKRLPSLKPHQRIALHKAVAKIEKDEYEALKVVRDQITFDVESFWGRIVPEDEFRFCLLGAQAANFGSLFFAYEDFIANAIRTKDSEFDSKNGSLKGEFARHFGLSLRDYCWPDDKAPAANEIDLLRRVRNTLVHNGGKYNDELQKRYSARFFDASGIERPELRGEQFLYTDDKIHITPRNTAYLFSVLKDRVSRIVGEVA